MLPGLMQAAMAVWQMPRLPSIYKVLHHCWLEALCEIAEVVFLHVGTEREWEKLEKGNRVLGWAVFRQAMMF